MTMPEWLRDLIGLPTPAPPSPLVREVLRLLISDRASWTRETHRLVHKKSRVAIWTANAEYGLHLEVNLNHFGHGVKIKLSAKERRAIYKTAQWEKFDRSNATWEMAAR
jgi:hypothetical protein